MINIINRGLVRRNFSIVGILRHPAIRVIEGKEVVLDSYDKIRHHELILAFLSRRTIKKSEVPPKITIIEQTMKTIESDLATQTINIKQRGLEEALNDKISLSERILLKFNQPFLIPLLQAYLSKVLINGRMPPIESNQQYNALLEKVISLYRVFFFGQQITPLEQTIQLQYLTIKRRNTEKLTLPPSNVFGLMKIIEELVNMPTGNTDLHSNTKTIGHTIQNTKGKKLEAQQTINNVMMLIFPFNLKWKLFTKYSFIRGSKSYYDALAHEHMARIVDYTHSEELSKFIGIPNDFEIQMALIDCHAWILIDKCKKIGTSEYKYLAAKLQASVKAYGTSQVGHLAIKKPDRFAKVLRTNTENHFKAFTYHFNMGGISRNNHYKGIDALIWANVFHQKVERYSDVVYRFSEYFIRNYDKIQNQSLETLNRCMLEFDKCLLEPGYVSKIEQINPRVPDEQFEKQFKEDKQMKSYYYSYLIKDDKDVIHLSKIYPNKKEYQPEEHQPIVASGWKKIPQQLEKVKNTVVGKLKKINLSK